MACRMGWVLALGDGAEQRAIQRPRLADPSPWSVQPMWPCRQEVDDPDLKPALCRRQQGGKQRHARQIGGSIPLAPAANT